MFFLIQDNKIVGQSDSSNIGLPQGFSICEGPNISGDLVYFSNGEILLRPPKPSPLHYWDDNQKSWELIVDSTLPLSLDWQGLVDSLENSPEWGKAYAASELTLKANTAFTTLFNTLVSLHKVSTLEFAIAKLREAMSEIPSIGDFTVEELASINQKLATAGFDLVLTELGGE